MSITYTPPQHIPANAAPVQRWTPFGGDPAPLSGDSDLIRQANGLVDAYQQRVANLQAAQQVIPNTESAIRALHHAFTAELERAAHAGETSTLAAELKEKRDRAEAELRGGDCDLAIDAAAGAVEQTRQAYVDFLETAWPGLIAEKVEAASEAVRALQKIEDDYRTRRDAALATWNRIYDDSRRIVGSLDGAFYPDDLPAATDYSKAPIPSAESIERNRPTPVIAPAPALIELPG